MFEIGQTIVDLIQNWESIRSDIDMSFDYDDIFGYLYIHATMLADARFTFYLICYWANDSFSISDRNIIDSSHDIIKSYSFNDQNYTTGA
jgi:hypothetical protein